MNLKSFDGKLCLVHFKAGNDHLAYAWAGNELCPAMVQGPHGPQFQPMPALKGVVRLDPDDSDEFILEMRVPVFSGDMTGVIEGKFATTATVFNAHAILSITTVIESPSTLVLA